MVVQLWLDQKSVKCTSFICELYAMWIKATTEVFKDNTCHVFWAVRVTPTLPARSDPEVTATLTLPGPWRITILNSRRLILTFLNSPILQSLPSLHRCLCLCFLAGYWWHRKKKGRTCWLFRKDSWWSILCAHLTGSRGAQTFGQMWFWVCLWGGFWLRLTLEWMKQVLPSCVGASSNQLKAWLEQQADPPEWRRQLLLPGCWAGTATFSCLRTQMETLALLGSGVTRLDREPRHWLSPVSDLLSADPGPCQPPWSHESIPLSLCVLLVLLLWRTLTNAETKRKMNQWGVSGWMTRKTIRM